MIWQREVVADGSPWRDYLSGLILHGIKLGLENIRQLLHGAGDPQNKYLCFHLAGTNGKGSSAAFLASILRTAGYRVGRFTSPHLLDITERFLIDAEPISEDELRENLEFYKAISDGMPSKPTFFEVNTAVALRWFAQQNVDVAVLETGMGGRFDATNVLERPLVCGITNVALDHMQYLGQTISEIAFEKAGIIKPDVPCVTTESGREALKIIVRRAREVRSSLAVSGEEFHFSSQGTSWNPLFNYRMEDITLNDLPLGLAGIHQSANAALAVTMALGASRRLAKIDSSAIAKGLEIARWPCRLERVLDDPPVLIDVAHNPAGAAAIAASVHKSIVIFAVSTDKDASSMLKTLQPISNHFILTRFSGARGMSISDLDTLASGLSHETADSLCTAIKRGLALARQDIPLLITGSVYAAAEARRIMIDHYGSAPLRF